MIEPMLCTSSTTASGRAGHDFAHLMRTGEWAADVKIDGVRALLHWDGSAVIGIINRNLVDISVRYPDVVADMAKRLAGRDALVLDGEIVSVDGSFETTLLRDQQVHPARIKAAVEQHPVHYIAFDLPEHGGPWLERRAALDELTEIHRTPWSDSEEFFATTRDLGLEGVVAKRKASRYEPGRRSRSWVKFRNRYRVTCLVAGYDVGTGSRSHFGAMFLALLDDGKPVSVGRVGTGFTARQTHELKKAIDAGEILTVEIECANQTSTGQLRFPVFRGVRTDVAPSDCSIEQLKFLPTC